MSNIIVSTIKSLFLCLLLSYYACMHINKMNELNEEILEEKKYLYIFVKAFSYFNFNIKNVRMNMCKSFYWDNDSLNL